MNTIKSFEQFNESKKSVKKTLKQLLDNEFIEVGQFVKLPGYPKALVDSVDYDEKIIELQFGGENKPIQPFNFNDSELDVEVKVDGEYITAI